MQISASTTESLLGEQPVLNRPNSGELIDYYGPCGEIPLGQDQPDTQRLDQYGWENNYTAIKHRRRQRGRSADLSRW